MKVPLAERKQLKEVISELSGPRDIIVCSLYGSTNQRSAVTCKGTFPFPFQAEGQIIESEVKACMQEIHFFCRKCKKSLKMSYILCGDDDAKVMNGINDETVKKVLLAQIKAVCAL